MGQGEHRSVSAVILATSPSSVSPLAMILTGPVGVYGYQALARLRTPGRYRGHSRTEADIPTPVRGTRLRRAPTGGMRIPAIRADAHATTTSATHMCEFGWPSPRRRTPRRRPWA